MLKTLLERANRGSDLSLKAKLHDAPAPVNIARDQLQTQQKQVDGFHDKLCAAARLDSSRKKSKDNDSPFSFLHPDSKNLSYDYARKVYPDPAKLGSKKLEELKTLLTFLDSHPESMLLGVNSGNQDLNNSQVKLNELLVTLAYRTEQIPEIDRTDSDDTANLLDAQILAKRLLQKKIDKNLSDSNTSLNLTQEQRDKQTKIKNLLFVNNYTQAVSSSSRDLDKLQLISSILDSVDSIDDLNTVNAITQNDAGEYFFTSKFYNEAKFLLGNDQLASELTEHISKDMSAVLRFSDASLYDDTQWDNEDQQKIRQEILNIQAKVFKKSLEKDFDLVDNPNSSAGFDIDGVQNLEQITAITNSQQRVREFKKLRLSLIKDILFPIPDDTNKTHKEHQKPLATRHREAINKFIEHTNEFQRMAVKKTKELQSLDRFLGRLREPGSSNGFINSLDNAIARSEPFKGADEIMEIPLRFLVDANQNLDAVTNATKTVIDDQLGASSLAIGSGGPVIIPEQRLDSTVQIMLSDLGDTDTEIRDNLNTIYQRADAHRQTISNDTEIDNLYRDMGKVYKDLMGPYSPLANVDTSFMPLLQKSIDAHKFNYLDKDIELAPEIYDYLEFAFENFLEDREAGPVSSEQKENVYRALRSREIISKRNDLFNGRDSIDFFNDLNQDLENMIQDLEQGNLVGVSIGNKVDIEKLKEIQRRLSNGIDTYANNPNLSNYATLSLEDQRTIHEKERGLLEFAFDISYEFMNCDFDHNQVTANGYYLPQQIIDIIDQENFTPNLNPGLWLLPNSTDKVITVKKALEDNFDVLGSLLNRKGGDLEDWANIRLEDKTFANLEKMLNKIRLAPASTSPLVFSRLRKQYRNQLKSVFQDPKNLFLALDDFQENIKEIFMAVAFATDAQNLRPLQEDFDSNYNLVPAGDGNNKLEEKVLTTLHSSLGS